MFCNLLKKKPADKYPELGSKMKTAVEIASELTICRDKQLEAARQNRKDTELANKIRFEALVWVLGKEYASAISG